MLPFAIDRSIALTHAHPHTHANMILVRWIDVGLLPAALDDEEISTALGYAAFVLVYIAKLYNVRDHRDDLQYDHICDLTGNALLPFV